MTVFALLGATALWLTYAWLASAIVASYLSDRKGYGERAGLASGLLLNVIGVVIWLVVPPKDESLWKKVGPFGPRRRASRRRGAGRGRAAASRRRPRRPAERLAGTLRVPARLRHRDGDASTLPPSPARGVTLHHTSVGAVVVDHQPEGVAEQAVRCLALGAGASNFDV